MEINAHRGLECTLLSSNRNKFTVDGVAKGSSKVKFLFKWKISTSACVKINLIQAPLQYLFILPLKVIFQVSSVNNNDLWGLILWKEYLKAANAVVGDKLNHQ